MAAQVNKSASQYNPRLASPLYLIIDDNLRRPVLQFDQYGEGMVLLDDAMGAVYDTKIPQILEKIGGQISNRRAVHEEKRIRGRKKAAGVAGVVLAATVAAGTPLYFIHENRTEKAAYDAQHVELPAESLSTGEADFVERQSGIFDAYIPVIVEEHIVRSPRLTEIDAGTCTQIGSVGLNGEVILVTDGPAQQVFAAIGNDGTVNVCALEDSTEDSGSQPSYQIAIQRN